MIFDALERVLRALDEAGVRYLVAGGVAVNAHGYERTTADLDLVLDLERDNVLAALEALERLGYGPTLPVDAREFADPETRARWHRERNMEVFSLVTAAARDMVVDIFVTDPFDFDHEHERALVAEIAPGLDVPFVSLDSLIRMKEETGRARDEDDAKHLRWIREEEGTDDG